MEFFKKVYQVALAAILMMVLSITAAFAAEPVTVTLNVTNTPIRGDVVLEKTGLQLRRFNDEKDSFGNTVMKPVYESGYLAGAVFELRAAENIFGKEGTTFYQKDELVETLTTSGTGTVKSKTLPLGRYYLKEISAPDGYVFSAAPMDVRLAAKDQQTALVEVKASAGNTYLPVRVSLSKRKEAIKLTETADGRVHQTVEVVPGEGFVFGLYNSAVIAYGNGQKLPANTLMATGATGADGSLTFSGYYPHGEYYVKEISVPAGWKLSTQTYPMTLTSAQKSGSENVIVASIAQPILNELIYTNVTLIKTDITGAETLPGALIEVKDANGTVIYREYTNENGEIPDIPVVPGTYTFRETYAPEGYALNVAEKTFTVAANGTVTGDTVIRDEINRVTLKKLRENGEVLPGALFGLFDEDGKQVQQATSTAEGIVQFSRIPFGSYTIRELLAPHGFHPSTEEWSVTIDGTYVNPSEVLATVVNTDAPGRIRITKLDELDNHPIAQVQFDIFAIGNDGKQSELVTTMVTDANGIAESEDLFAGDYIVVEHENPVGYVDDLWQKVVTVDMDETTELAVSNMPIQGKIRIMKTDAETGCGLPGAVFTVTRLSGLPSHNGDKNDEIVAVLTSDENGFAETPLLTWGEYSVVETRVPDDYIDSGYSVIVTIPDDGVVLAAEEVDAETVSEDDGE